MIRSLIGENKLLKLLHKKVMCKEILKIWKKPTKILVHNSFHRFCMFRKLEVMAFLEISKRLYTLTYSILPRMHM